MLLITSDYQRTSESLEYFLKGLYRLEDLNVYQEIDHTEQLYSPIEGTSYDTMLKSLWSEKCAARNILRVPFDLDVMISHKENEALRRFLLTDMFDLA